ncbi:NUDIX domain-containing protein [Segnochrobactrum spirostomi]|uniref:NUDIX domain-containing protein n=1 Tax=Segnochrobactrum spirostomi TaxID=2608987 RepID=A0A6A7XZ60_9HYPH|nr:NUDIX domain-containing protein [Segnochrobactrum spirostomi]MQT11586.1 NUDIX domain-containing protein [Segnochrobactrum spirostomi]
MSDFSAGILMFRRQSGVIEVLLAHPGGPFWRSKDRGAWMIIKGGPEPGETAEAAARREWQEETGRPAEGPLAPLGEIRQRGGKRVEAFALEGAFDPAGLTSNTFELEWPPRSGRTATFPEIDAVRWFPLDEAAEMILVSQRPLLDRLAELLAEARPHTPSR